MEYRRLSVSKCARPTSMVFPWVRSLAVESKAKDRYQDGFPMAMASCLLDMISCVIHQ